MGGRGLYISGHIFLSFVAVDFVWTRPSTLETFMEEARGGHWEACAKDVLIHQGWKFRDGRGLRQLEILGHYLHD